jgi:hypothetical protein
MTYQVNVGLAGGRLARGQGARNVLHSPKVEFVICSYINVNYLIDSNRKIYLDSPVLLTFPQEFKIILDQR